jgi:hypothetical protein
MALHTEVCVPRASESVSRRRLSSLRRLSGGLSKVCLLLAIVLPVTVAGVCASWSDADWWHHAPVTSPPAALVQPLANWQRITLLLLALLPVSTLAAALLRARTCLAGIAAGAFFAPGTVAALRGFAAGVCAATLLGALVTTLGSAVLTYELGHGQRQLAVHFGSHELLQLLVAGLTWVVAGALAEAQALADENAQFV